jgi:undecaprenyl-diphosphatase
MATLGLMVWIAQEVLKGDTVWFDERVREIVNRQAAPWLTALMQAITLFGSVRFLFFAGTLLMIVLAAAKWRREWVLLVTTMGGASLLNVTLKLSFQRTRPSPFFGTDLPSSFSFPSGHALLSLCFYWILAHIAASRQRSAWVRGGLWSAASLLIGAIGFSRIYLGVHYPTDVLAAFAAGSVWIGFIVVADCLNARDNLRSSHGSSASVNREG